MFEIIIQKTFCAAHAIKLYDGSIEALHGHNWQVEITVFSAELDQIGMVLDFHQLEQQVDQILKPFNNNNLNQCSPFLDRINPTAENVARWIGEEVAKGLPKHVRLHSTKISEAPGCFAVYKKQNQ